MSDVDTLIATIEELGERLRHLETLEVVQPLSGSITTLSTNTVLDSSYDVILVDASGGAVTLTLPVAALSLGYSYTVKKIDASANAVTLDGDGGETIDNSLTVTTTTQYDVFRVVCDGVEWWLI